MSGGQLATDAEPGTANGLLATVAFWLDRLIEFVCASLLVATTGIAVLQVFYRYVLNNSLYWPEEAARWAFVWTVFLGMALGIARHGHIAIDILAARLKGRARDAHGVFAQAAVTVASLVFVDQGFGLVAKSSYVSPALEWPYVYLYLAVPAGGVLSLVFLALRGVEPMTRGAMFLGLAIGAVVYFGVAEAAVPLLHGIDTGSLLLAVSLALILLGVPVAFALAVGCLFAFAPQGPLMLVALTQNMTSALDSFLLLAIPFFILAAAMMNEGGITGRLVDLATRLVGHFRGGLGHVNVLTNGMMAGVSGSSMADAAAISKILVPEMEKRGYPRPFSCALTSASSVVANLIPPSLGLIIFGALASASVGALFVAAIVPGLMLLAVLAIVVAVISRRRGYGADVERATGAERRAAFVSAMPALTLPVFIVGGVRFGIFTATEAGAIAVVYAIFCGVVLYRQLTPRNLLSGLREALQDTIAVMVIIATAAPFAWILAIEQAPQMVAASLGGIATNWVALILLLNVFLLLVGLIMEMIAAMVILVPIFVPLVTAAGIDPIQFGVVVVINLVIGALTPPLGMLIFTTARVGKTDVALVFRAVLPFLVGLVFVLLIVSLFPVFTVGVNRLIGP